MALLATWRLSVSARFSLFPLTHLSACSLSADHRPDRRQGGRRAARLHEKGGGGPQLRGDAAPQVWVPGEHPGGAAAAPLVGRRDVPGRRLRGAGGAGRPAGHRRRALLAAGPDAAAATDAPCGPAAVRALRPLRRRHGGRRAHAHHAVDEQPRGAALQAALRRAGAAGRTRARARRYRGAGAGCGQQGGGGGGGGRVLAAVPRRGARGEQRRRRREHEHERLPRRRPRLVVLLCQRGQQ
ncbi:hypothetical protein U9M48_029165 [Paspalum notatum var. saurae]|uniref:Uncharacterized protein n=1 Tax=Paspalum notatum var. saurae TaxID=547442 RepID=A0AAQ3TYU2_PASNO